jgi:hypothetical protein
VRAHLLADGLSPCAWLVAGAFKSQMVEKVPVEGHDVPMDVVVTENGHYPPEPLSRWASHLERISKPRGIGVCGSDRSVALQPPAEVRESYASWRAEKWSQHDLACGAGLGDDRGYIWSGAVCLRSVLTRDAGGF